MEAKEIASFLGLPLQGKNILINSICTMDEIKKEAICFAKSYNSVLIERTKGKEVLVICCEEYVNRLDCTYIISNNPRLDYIRVINAFFQPKKNYEIASTAIVKSKVNNVSIGNNVIIYEDVEIGEGTQIGDNVVIHPNTKVGKNCIIKSGAVIGSSGFGYEMDENGIPIQFYHLGGVIIGDNVHIGVNTAIDRATLSNTIIENNVKIDNLIHIAHNVYIGENTLVTAKAEVSGGVKIGKNAWLGPNCCIKEQLRIGNNSMIGIGAVVVKDTEDNSIYVGNPAKFLRNR